MKQNKDKYFNINYLIVSCYNNGVLFLKVNEKEFEEYNSTISPLLELTYNFNLPNIESIYTEKAFMNK